jgi:methylenetetrahydrofolate reductase (NADH)
MKLRELYPGERVRYSFEFFPPRTDEGERQLWTAIRELEPLHPTFVSVTDGAGGSTRERTASIVARVASQTEIVPVAHLTCVGSSRASLREALESYVSLGIENIMALRGDPPRGETEFVPAPDGFAHAIELVRLIHEVGDFSVGVAGYPEPHPEARDFETGIVHLAEKVRAGADLVVTQFFFYADDYFRLCDALQRHGVDVPVVPGIMPVTNVRQIRRMAELQGSAFPADLAERLVAVEDDPEAVKAIGVEVATELCDSLLEGGAPGLHFYTLNRSTATREIAAHLGLGERAPRAEGAAGSG